MKYVRDWVSKMERWFVTVIVASFLFSLATAQTDEPTNDICLGLIPAQLSDILSCQIEPLPKYYWNQDEGECQSLENVCQEPATTNVFDTMADCERSCRCTLPKSNGQCPGLRPQEFPRFVAYWDPPTTDGQAGSCKMTIYYGCDEGRIGNRFESLAKCTDTCSGARSQRINILGLLRPFPPNSINIAI